METKCCTGYLYYISQGEKTSQKIKGYVEKTLIIFLINRKLVRIFDQ